jgi:hypothetical protein
MSHEFRAELPGSVTGFEDKALLLGRRGFQPERGLKIAGFHTPVRNA